MPPTPRDVVAVAKLADEAIEVAPLLSQKLALALPEIFGQAGSAARIFKAAPGEAAILDDAAIQFHRHLSGFGLPKTATPTNLYDAAKASGLEPHLIRRSGSGHYSGAHEIIFNDGTALTQFVGAGRSGRTVTTLFQTGDRQAGLFDGYSNFFRESRRTLGFNTPNVRFETAVLK